WQFDRKLFPVLLCCFAPRVAMVQATEARHRSHVCASCRLRLDWPLVRGVFLERVMNSPGDNFPPSVLRFHFAKAIECLSASVSNPSPSKSDHVSIEFRITVEDHIAV